MNTHSQSYKLYLRVMTFQLSPNKTYLCLTVAVRETGHRLMVHETMCNLFVFRVSAPSILAVRNNGSPICVNTSSTLQQQLYIERGKNVKVRLM